MSDTNQFIGLEETKIIVWKNIYDKYKRVYNILLIFSLLIIYIKLKIILMHNLHYVLNSYLKTNKLIF